jgi:hypothetical protein
MYGQTKGATHGTDLVKYFGSPLCRRLRQYQKLANVKVWIQQDMKKHGNCTINFTVCTLHLMTTHAPFPEETKQGIHLRKTL